VLDFPRQTLADRLSGEGAEVFVIPVGGLRLLPSHPCLLLAEHSLILLNVAQLLLEVVGFLAALVSLGDFGFEGGFLSAELRLVFSEFGLLDPNVTLLLSGSPASLPGARRLRPDDPRACVPPREDWHRERPRSGRLDVTRETSRSLSRSSRVWLRSASEALMDVVPPLLARKMYTRPSLAALDNMVFVLFVFA
jgi:hypothetical protein